MEGGGEGTCGERERRSSWVATAERKQMSQNFRYQLGCLCSLVAFGVGVGRRSVHIRSDDLRANYFVIILKRIGVLASDVADCRRNGKWDLMMQMLR